MTDQTKPLSDDNPVDMDELTKEQESLDSSTVKTDPDPEPESEIQESDKVEEVEEPTIDE